MPEPILTAYLLAAAGIAIVKGGQAIGRGIEAKGIKLSDEEQRELDQLVAAESEDEEALSGSQLRDIQQQFTAEQGAAAREAQAAQLSAAAARGGAVATSGRELFIAEQVQQAELQKRAQRESSAVSSAKAEARASRVRRIAYLQDRFNTWQAAKSGAAGAAVSAPFEAAGGALTTVAGAALTGDLPVGEVPLDTDDVESYALV